MTTITPDAGAKVLNEFISLGKEIVNLSKSAFPEYKDCARDLYTISKSILDANENTTRWLNRFLYFDFHSASARSDFLKSVQEYKTMKNGNERKLLKYSCSDIGNVYYGRIQNKMGQWFSSNKSKINAAQQIFTNLSNSDASMVQFIEEFVISTIDEIISKLEDSVDKNDFDNAERIRIESKRTTKDILLLIETFNNEFSDLVIDFAKMSNTPITLKP